jgi:DNA-binding NtrC family response regulator
MPALNAEHVRNTHFGLLRVLDERGNVRPLSELEQELIRLAIDHYQGQMSEVARRLGIGRSTLYRKLKEYGIDPQGRRGESPVFQRNPQFPI